MVLAIAALTIEGSHVGFQVGESGLTYGLPIRLLGLNQPICSCHCVRRSKSNCRSSHPSHYNL